MEFFLNQLRVRTHFLKFIKNNLNGIKDLLFKKYLNIQL